MNGRLEGLSDLVEDDPGLMRKSYEGFALSGVQTRLLSKLFLDRFKQITEIEQAAPYLQYVYPAPGGRP